MLQVLYDIKSAKSPSLRYVSPQAQLLDTMEGLGLCSQQEYLALKPVEPLWMVQEEAVAFIERREASGGSTLYCDEMGLGKSRTVLQVVLERNQSACIESGDCRKRHCGTTLIVCAPMLVNNWVTEMKKFPPLSLTWRVITEAREIARCPRFLLECCCDAVLTTYDVLTTARCNPRKYSQLMFDVPWRRLVLDEAHIIVNRATEVAHTAFALQAQSKIAMTGTPVRNRLPDLLTLVHFIGLQTEVETTQQLTRELLDSIMLARTREQVLETQRRLLAEQPGRSLHCLPELKKVTRRVQLVQFRTLAEKVLYYTYAKIALQRRLNYRYNTPMLIGLMRQLCISPAVIKNLVLPAGMLSSSSIVTSGGDDDDLFLDQFLATVKRGSDNPVTGFMWQQPVASRITYRGGPAYSKTDSLYTGDDMIVDGVLETNIEWDPFCTGLTSSSAETRAQYTHLYRELKRQLRERPREMPIVTEDMLLEPVMWSASLNAVKQMLSHLLDRIVFFDRTPSSKEAAIVRYVRETPSDDRVIIFSDYTGVLMGLERALLAEGLQCVVMTGLTDSKTNAGRLRKFQSNRGIKVLLMTLKLGYMGLNLMRDANHIVHVDPWWNPWVTEQADYRIIRPGQLKPIFITYFIMDDTIEVAIMNHTIRKKSLLKALMASGGAGEDNVDDGAKLSGEDETLLFDYEVDIVPKSG